MHGTAYNYGKHEMQERFNSSYLQHHKNTTKTAILSLFIKA